jgi:hypothetical protein
MTKKIHGSFKNASCSFVVLELLQFVGQTKRADVTWTILITQAISLTLQTISWQDSDSVSMFQVVENTYTEVFLELLSVFTRPVGPQAWQMSHEAAINFPSFLTLISSYFDASLTVSLHNFGALYFSDTNIFQFLEYQYSYQLRKWSWDLDM